MNSKHLDRMTRAAALSAYLQTQQEVEKSQVLAAKLVGEELRHHLLKNTDLIRKNLQQQYKEASNRGKRKLLRKWKQFIDEHKDRWPEQLDLIKATTEETSS